MDAAAGEIRTSAATAEAMRRGTGRHVGGAMIGGGRGGGGDGEWASYDILFTFIIYNVLINEGCRVASGKKASLSPNKNDLH